MATETVSEARGDQFKQEQGERGDIALNAAQELEGLAHALILQSQNLPEAYLVVRSLGIRAKELASIILSSLTDPVESPASIRERLTGIRESEVTHG